MLIRSIACWISNYFTNISYFNFFTFFKKRKFSKRFEVRQNACYTEIYALGGISTLITENSLIRADSSACCDACTNISTTIKLIDTLRFIINKTTSSNNCASLTKSNRRINIYDRRSYRYCLSNSGSTRDSECTFNQIPVIVSNKQTKSVECFVISSKDLNIRNRSISSEISRFKYGLSFQTKRISRDWFNNNSLSSNIISGRWFYKSWFKINNSCLYTIQNFEENFYRLFNTFWLI